MFNYINRRQLAWAGIYGKILEQPSSLYTSTLLMITFIVHYRKSHLVNFVEGLVMNYHEK